MRGNKLFRFIDFYIGILLSFILYFINNLFFRKQNIIKDKFTNILIIKLSALGDTILLIPILRTLKENYPDSKISFICTTININAIKNCSYIDKLILFDISGSIKNPIKIINFIFRLYKEKYELVIDFDQWLRISSIISFLSGAKIRIGFNTEGQYKHLLFTNTIKHNRQAHEIDCFFDLIRPLKINITNKNLEFNIPETGKLDVETILDEYNINPNDFIILICPGVPEHGWQRQWPIENYAELCNSIKKKYKCKILAVDTNKFNLQKISELTSGTVIPLFDLSFITLAGIISKSNLVICNNSGIMHLASAIGTTVIALHGPTDYRKWGPYGKNHNIIKSNCECSPCLYLGFEYKCNTRKCMESITVKEVLTAIDNLIYKFNYSNIIKI